MLKKLFVADYKRIREYILPFAAMLAVLFSFAFVFTIHSDKMFYQKTSKPSNIGIVMSAESSYSTSIYNFIANMTSYKNTCSFIHVSSENECITLLKNGEIEAAVIVPDNVITDIMDGTNTPVKVYYPNDGTIETYIINELFVSTSSLLGISQAAIYSTFSLCRELGITGEAYDTISEEINMLFISCVLQRYELFVEKELQITDGCSLFEHYAATFMFLLPAICSIILIAFYRSNNNAVKNLLKTYGVNSFQITLSQLTSVFSVLYLFYIIIYLLMYVCGKYSKRLQVNITLYGLFVGIIICAAIALILALISRLPVSISAASVIMLFIIFIIAYTGGMIIPEALLPGFIKNIYPYTPGHAIIKLICNGIYK